MCGTAKQEQRMEESADRAQQTAQSEGQRAEQNIIKAGQPSAQESQLQQRFMTKSSTPGEQLLQEQGAVSQAVAQRILERATNPGMDFDQNSAAFEQSIGQPVWRGLKARGIAAPPGSEGGGLGTQQYMSGVAPAMAEARSNQINTDLNRGQAYGEAATAQQNYFTNLATLISNELANRNLSATQSGTGYRVEGMNRGAAINQESVAGQYERQAAETQQIYDAIGSMLGLALSSGTSGATTSTGGTTKALGSGNALDFNNYQSPASRQLGLRGSVR